MAGTGAADLEFLGGPERAADLERVGMGAWDGRGLLAAGRLGSGLGAGTWRLSESD